MPSGRTHIKICGTTTLADALDAAEAGADAIGLIFAPISKRHIMPDAARRISLAVGPAVGRVGVFLGQSVTEILRLSDAARVSAVQVHGEFSAAELTELAGWYPVLRVVSPQMLGQHLPNQHPEEAFPPHLTLMLDAPQPGSGQPLDWAALAPRFPAGSWLAGGLGPHNVADAVGTLRPAGVDAVSALEQSPGIKDAARVRAFVNAVRRADARLDAEKRGAAGC